MEQSHTFEFSDAGKSLSLAVKVRQSTDNTRCGFVWFGGFKSDMMGTKAEVMVEHGQSLGCNTLRFDYSGHGESSGDVVERNISNWVSESVAILRNYTSGPQIIVGSSMGGWIALRVAQELGRLGESDRIAGMLLIAPAPDFTSELIEPSLTDEQRNQLETAGRLEEHSEYADQPNVFTAEFLEDGRNNSVLNGELIVKAPVRILQGMADPDVPYEHALKLVSHLPHDNVTITLVKDGDHRLSTDENLELLKRTMDEMVS